MHLDLKELGKVSWKDMHLELFWSMKDKNGAINIDDSEYKRYVDIQVVNEFESGGETTD